jgi:putative flippase GtrA
LKQFFRFCLVGALGFVTDFGVLYLGVKVVGLGTVVGRILSFIVAATVTWKANRHFTFVQQGRGSMREWLQYLLLTSVGGGINVVVYQIWLWFTDHSTLNLFLAVAAGSAVALLFNFAISKRMVFSKPELPL